MNRSELRERILQCTASEFHDLALDIFRFQYTYNPVYSKFCTLTHRSPDNVHELADIPFLPIQLFKTCPIITGAVEPVYTFSSSTTGSGPPSKHHIHDPELYRIISERSALRFPGDPSGFIWLGLLPSYLERKDASLIYMVNHFMHLSGHEANGYFLYDHDKLAQVLAQCESQKLPAVLIGVSYALLDFASSHSMPLDQTLVIETGGMKGRREEITREQLHAILGEAFSKQHIGSEYGMTELLSQAWSEKEGIFHPGPVMRVFIRDLTDPLTLIEPGKRGAISVIDLANLDSCAFIATDDIGISHPDGSFEVLGRMDASDIRGCNLMVGEEK